MKISIKVDERDLERLDERLGGVENCRTELKQAINKTAKKAKKLLIDQAMKEYRYGAGKTGISSASRIKNATGSFDNAEIVFTSFVKEPRDYYLSGGITYSYKKDDEKFKRFRIKTGAAGALYRNYGGGVKGAVLRSESPKTFEGKTGKAFIVRFESGHIAVVTRDPKEIADKFKGKKLTKHTQKLRAWRSPSIPTMIGNKKVYGKLQPNILEEMHTQVQNVIEKVIYG